MRLQRPAALALIFLFSLVFAACSGKADPTAPSLDFPGSTGSTGSNDGNSAGSTQFEGPVTDVDVPGSRVRLASGQTVRVDGSTQWSRLGDVIDLASLATAVSQGRASRVEGSGISQSDGSVLAATLKAEIDDSGSDDGDDSGNDPNDGDDSSNDDGDGSGDDDGSEDSGSDDDGDDSGSDDLGPVNEFEGTVSSVNVAGGSVQLTNGSTVVVDSDTRWDALGDVMSLSALASRIAAGNTGRVEGDGQVDGGVIRAVVIKAEIDEPDDDADDDDFDDDDSDDDSDDDDNSGPGGGDDDDDDDSDDDDDDSDDDDDES